MTDTAKSAKQSARPDGNAGLSVVVPCFNEAAGLPHFHRSLTEALNAIKASRGLRSEIVYVDDGSRDETYAVATSLPANGVDVQVIGLSRNFGKEAALMAGLHHARFGAVLFMDGDGQHPPALIDTLLGYWLDRGYDVIYTAKAHRESEPALHRFGVKIFYRLINWRSRQKIPEDAGDFRLVSPRAANALRQLPERNRFFKGLASWIGFKQVRVDYEPEPRAYGRSTWNLASLIGLSIEGLTSFSVVPLRIAGLLGLVMAVVALVFGASILWETMIYGKSVPGYPSVVVGMMVLGSVQLIMIGVVGEYVGKILSEQKARPVYFVAEQSLKTADGKTATQQTAAE